MGTPPRSAILALFLLLAGVCTSWAQFTPLPGGGSGAGGVNASAGAGLLGVTNSVGTNTVVTFTLDTNSASLLGLLTNKINQLTLPGSLFTSNLSGFATNLTAEASAATIPPLLIVPNGTSTNALAIVSGGVDLGGFSYDAMLRAAAGGTPARASIGWHNSASNGLYQLSPTDGIGISVYGTNAVTITNNGTTALLGINNTNPLNALDVAGNFLFAGGGTNTGPMGASTFYGDASHLTGLSASQLLSGTVPVGQLGSGAGSGLMLYDLGGVAVWSNAPGGGVTATFNPNQFSVGNGTNIPEGALLTNIMNWFGEMGTNGLGSGYIRTNGEVTQYIGSSNAVVTGQYARQVLTNGVAIEKLDTNGVLTANNFSGPGLGLTNVDSRAIAPYQMLTFAGQTLNNTILESGSSGAAIVRQTGLGTQLDSVATNGSVYTPHGSNMMGGVIKWVGRLDQSYGASILNHGGVGLDWTDDNNWACLVMINSISNAFEVHDRYLGTEYVDDILTAGVIPGMIYEIDIYATNTLGNVTNATINILTNGVLMVTKSHNWNSAVAAHITNGWQFEHTYAAVLETYTNRIYASDGVTLISDGVPWMEVASGSVSPNTRYILNGGSSLEISNNTANWINDVSPLGFKDGIISGTWQNVSGRAMGFTFRNNDNGYGYAFYYDNTSQALEFGIVSAAGITILQTSGTFLLTQATNYPAQVLANGNQFTLSVGGTNYTVTDNTIQQSGHCGVVTFNDNAIFSNIRVQPLASGLSNTISTVFAQHYSGSGTAPTIVTNGGAGSGTGTVVVDANASDSAMTITLATGTLPTASATVFTGTFKTGYATAPHLIFCPANNNAAALNGVTMVFPSTTTGGFTFTSGGTGLSGATTYMWNVWVVK